MMEKEIRTSDDKATRQLSSRGRVISIIFLFSFIALLLQGVIYLQGNIFDGVRSYVRGEGLWAKAQKDAVLYLYQYSYSHSEQDYQAYLEAIKANIGDKNARLALSSQTPNIDKARIGFLQGNNSPEDIDSMIWFYLNFQRISYLRKAIGIWREADAKISLLNTTAEELHYEIEVGGNHPARIDVLRNKLQKLNLELLSLENSFSQVLGEGARWVKKTTWVISISILVIFISLGIFISSQIIKGLSRSERQLMASESRFRSLRDSNTIGIVTWNVNGVIEEANDSFLDMLGYRHSDLASGEINWRKLTPNSYARRDERAIGEIQEYGRCEPYEKVFLHKDGSPIPVYLGASSLGTDSQQGIAFVMDLSDRKKSEEQTRLAATVFASSNDGIMITDRYLKIVSTNQALCNMTGYSQEELIGQKPAILKSGQTRSNQYRAIRTSLRSSGHWQGDIVDRHKNGTLLPIRISISSVKNNEQRITHYVATLSDISERKAREDHLRQLAHFDSLTGLPNRALLYDRIEQLLKQPEQSENRFALLFFDLDNFKPVNDQHGHLIGDKLLQEVAHRLSNSIRGIDMVTRLGGDEFIVLLENVSDKQVVIAIREKIIASVCRPCNIDGNDVNLSVSVGTSVYPEDGLDAESLLHHADIAMYGMKESRQPTQTDNDPRA